MNLQARAAKFWRNLPLLPLYVLKLNKESNFILVSLKVVLTPSLTKDTRTASEEALQISLRSSN